MPILSVICTEKLRLRVELSSTKRGPKEDSGIMYRIKKRTLIKEKNTKTEVTGPENPRGTQDLTSDSGLPLVTL